VNKLAVIVLLLGLAACSNEKEQEGREPVQAATPVIGSAVATPATSPGATAPGSAAPGSAASSYGVDCATAQVAPLVCDASQRDGCTGGLTSVHVCVAGDAKAGPPCTEQTAMTCPAGQVDACGHSPPQATSHVCVVVAKPNP